MLFVGCKQRETDRFEAALKINKEEIKEYAYSKCIQYSYPGRYGINDSLDLGPLILSDNLQSKDFLYKIGPMLDSLAKDRYLKSDKRRFDENVAEGASGKGPYAQGCLLLYNSKELDSLSTMWAEDVTHVEHMILD